MRSAVSVILSSSSPDPNMAHPDYSLTVQSHADMLLMIKHLDEDGDEKWFEQVFSHLSSVKKINLLDSAGNERNITARFVKDYPVGNNDWGDFQTHRKLLGLVSVSKCNSQSELNEYCRLHESLKVKYMSTLFDTRCILFGNCKDLSPPSNFKSTALMYDCALDGCKDELTKHMNELLSSVFWILESKLQERSREKGDKIPMLLAPFEKKDFVGLDMDSRTNKKRCMGRMTKHLGDLSLQAGLPQEALAHYNTAVDVLRAITDWLWLGGALEGLSAVSILLLPMQQKVPTTSTSVQRNSSFQEKSPRTLRPVSAIIERTISLTSVSNIDYIPVAEIKRNYRDAIIHYSKYQNAGFIETEACFKAARFALDQKCVLDAHHYLQGVIQINLVLTEEEKIAKKKKNSDSCHKLGFNRKAAFYKRLAATRYVSARNPMTDWAQCYQLMLQSLPGHRLTLDPADFTQDRLSGWPSLQKQVLQDLVVAAKRLGNSGLATRHMTFLLQVMWRHMNPAERVEAANNLRHVTAQCEGAPVPLVLEDGQVIPAANLLNIPQAENFTVQNLEPHLRPKKLVIAKEDYGPFLFTPLHFGSMDRKQGKFKQTKLDYVWVCGDPCCVTLELSNPLPSPLEVSNILLLTQGVYESIPVSVVLPPESTGQVIKLMGVPKEVGDLQIMGYSTHTLGVKSNCQLSQLTRFPHPPHYSIEVIPALPLISVTTSLDPSATCSLYAGESVTCYVRITNTSEVPITILQLSIDSLIETQDLISWDNADLEKLLPIAPMSSVQMPLHLYGAANFLAVNNDSCSLRSCFFSGPSSLPSFSTPQPVSTSSVSYRSGASSLLSDFSQRHHSDKSCSELHLVVKYSGGESSLKGYCRLASIPLKIDVLPSIMITNCDVLPGEVSSQFYLVLDVVNVTPHEVELRYTEGKSILIEETGSCRVPIPVARCPFSASLLEVEQHVLSQVILHWSIGARTGKASFSGLPFNIDKLDLVKLSPVSWELTVNGSPIESGSEVTGTVGDCLSFDVKLRNCLSHTLSDLTLVLSLFQDHLNGVVDHQMDSKATAVGTTQASISTVEENEAVGHAVGFLFFYPGLYKLSVQCIPKSEPDHTWKLVPPLEIHVT
ncbi:protein brunelleschi [Diaphorina citri]|uniref:Protein brunelleschi n=1 Tax=Diaphorina citri TaxID=121845 RepID=A0A3Q0IYC8_DIACI|nr:protein brunelleschi [Diaphorina citri]